MRYFTFPLVLILILSFPLLAQVPDTLWLRAYGADAHDYGNCLDQTSDGGFIIFGQSNPGEQGLMLKVDNMGIEQWSQTYGDEDFDDFFYSGFQTSDDGYICAGMTESAANGQFDFWLVRTNFDGELQWSQTFGGAGNDICNCVQPTNDGGYILAGNTVTFGNESTDWWLIKTDANGNEEWNQPSGIAEYDCANDIKQTTDGGFILTGGMASPDDESTNIHITKVDAQGTIEWIYVYGNENRAEYGQSVVQTNDGGYAATGFVGTGYNDLCLIKIDAEGNEEWVHSMGDPDYSDYGYSLRQTADYGYIISGSFGNIDNGSMDGLIIKTDPSGNVEWEKLLGESGNDYAQYIYITDNYKYITTGCTSSYGNGGYNIWLACLEAEITPRPFVLLTPTNSQMLHVSDINFAWSSSSSFFPEYDVRYDLSVNMTMPGLDTTTVFYGITDTSIILSVHDLTGLHEWEQMLTGYWHVEAIAGPDTTLCDADFLFRVSTIQGNAELQDNEVPETFEIKNIYPNPFNSSTTITISIPERSNLCLSIYNITGQEVAVLTDRQVNTGNHEFVYRANDLSSGVYFLHAYVPGKMNVIKKVVLLQ